MHIKVVKAIIKRSVGDKDLDISCLWVIYIIIRHPDFISGSVLQKDAEINSA